MVFQERFSERMIIQYIDVFFKYGIMNEIAFETFVFQHAKMYINSKTELF